ncbi:hypothetical protein V1264_018763 [Littorina saxatilis]|uniref:Uncharacterized protein n=3 Tax=Littorina saxatilis TaxID=31220 RepID=A0AAN9BDS4_9CAEN
MVEFSRIHAGEKINETEDHVRRATNDYYAYISNMASLLPAVDENCDLMVLEETFLPLQYAIALQKDSPLTDTVSTWILQMNEGGLDLLWASNWWTSTEGKCGTNKMTEMNVVTLMDCQSAFFVLLLGFVVALLAVCGESVFHWFVRRKYQTGTDEHIPTSPTRWENGGPKSLWDLSNSFSSRPSGGLRSLWELSSTDSSSSIRPSSRASSKTNGHACNGISSISRPELDDVFDDITDFNHGLQSVFTDDEPTCNHRRNGAVHFNV